MNVLLDVNILGRGHSAEITRTGIFRATEGLTAAMLRRTDLSLRFSAEHNWASELLLLAYDRANGGTLASGIMRAWEQPGLPDAEAQELIAHVATARLSPCSTPPRTGSACRNPSMSCTRSGRRSPPRGGSRPGPAR